MNALNQLLPLAVGILISPLPIVAIVAIVLSSRGRTAAPAFTAAFAAVTLAFIALGAASSAGASAASGSHAGSTVVVLVLTIALTVGFAALALASWFTRPRAGAREDPGWLAAIDTITPTRAAGLGLIMAVTNSKNIPLELKGGSLIGAAHLQPVVAVLLCLALTVVGVLALLVPTLLAASGSARVAAGLGRVKTEMMAHNALIMTVLFAILAANEGAHLIHQLA